MLAEILGSSTRARLLRVLLAEPRPIPLRELVRRVGKGASAVQRDVDRLEAIGLLRSERSGNRRLVSLRRRHPLFPEVEALVVRAASLERSSALPSTVNPAVRPLVPRLVESCRRHHASRVSLFGSSTQVDPETIPGDLDILVRFGDDADDRLQAYFDLKAELEAIMGMPVDIIEEGAVRNPYLAEEIERTKVVVYEAA